MIKITLNGKTHIIRLFRRLAYNPTLEQEVAVWVARYRRITLGQAPTKELLIPKVLRRIANRLD